MMTETPKLSGGWPCDWLWRCTLMECGGVVKTRHRTEKEAVQTCWWQCCVRGVLEEASASLQDRTEDLRDKSHIRSDSYDTAMTSTEEYKREKRPSWKRSQRLDVYKNRSRLYFQTVLINALHILWKCNKLHIFVFVANAVCVLLFVIYFTDFFMLSLC